MKLHYIFNNNYINQIETQLINNIFIAQLKITNLISYII